jgi:hypothetical protein
MDLPAAHAANGFRKQHRNLNDLFATHAARWAPLLTVDRKIVDLRGPPAPRYDAVAGLISREHHEVRGQRVVVSREVASAIARGPPLHRSAAARRRAGRRACASALCARALSSRQGLA